MQNVQITDILEGVGIGDLLWYAVAGLVVTASAMVVFTRNIIYSAFSLLLALLGVAVLYVYLAADFIAVIQIMIYVGGILTLILFAVMMTNRIDKIQISNTSFGLLQALPPAAILAAILAYCAKKTPWEVLKAPASNPTTSKIGNAFLTDYLLPFEIASVVLLVCLIGAVVIARHQVRGQLTSEPPLAGRRPPN